MNIWIIVNGEKQGPFADFEIRKKIQKSEVGPDTAAWHDGMAKWTPLVEISLFEREFGREEEEPKACKSSVFDRIPAKQEKPVNTESALRNSFWMRRFWARWLDMHVLSGIVWLVLYFTNVDVGAAFRNPWLLLIIYLPWVPVESYLLARFQATPGKWLLGLRVVNADGTSMDSRRSMRRALRVYFLGVGMGWGIVSLICQSLAFFFVRANGRALWDLEGNTVVESKPWKWQRLPLFIIAYILAVQMQWIVVAPYWMEDVTKRYPKWSEWIKNTPPQHLPRKH